MELLNTSRSGLGHIEWHIPSVILGKPDNKIHQTLIDMINDHSLEQIEDKPTRSERTFNLILTRWSTIATKNYVSVVRYVHLRPNVCL
jgi:hypothetical protein